MLFRSIVEEAIKLYWDGKYTGCAVELNKLPTEEKLLEELIEKLKGKSVYSTLKRVQEKKDTNSFIALKGITSLLTHCLIECEHDNKEYRMLIPTILEKINQLGFEIC